MLTVNFSPFPVLETERLILRRLINDDVKGVFMLRSNPELMFYIPRPLAQNDADALEHIAQIDDKIQNNIGINWAICLKDNPEFIGLIGLFKIDFENYRSELGYMLLSDFHGKGIVTEAIHEVLRYGFENMQLHSVEAIIDPEHQASERVLQKNGFIKEAHIKENEYFGGKFWDTVIYSILKRNFKK